MASKTPLVLNQVTARVEELAAADTIPGFMVEGLVGRNIVINGDFRFWQRGTSFIGMTSGAYTADRFIPVMLGDSIDCIRAEHQLGDATNLFNSRYFMRCSVNQVAGTGNLATLQYRIENGVRLLAGKTVTVSMLVRASSATKMGLEFEMTFGTGGSPSPSIYGNSQLVTGITGGWQRISKTFTLADIAGKTFGTTTEGYLSLIMWLDAGSSWDARSAGVGRQAGDFQFSNIQIEVGNVATDFEQRPDAVELALCQRYYEKSYDLSTNPGTATSIGENAFFLYGLPNTNYAGGMTSSFKVSKRSTPAITVYSTQTGAPGKLYSPGTSSDVNATVVGVGQNAFFAQSASFGPTVTLNLWWHWTADAEL